VDFQRCGCGIAAKREEELIKISKIAKNTFAVLFGTLVRMASSFVLTFLIARYLGVKSVGQYTVLISLFWIFQRIATIGLEQIIIREVAKDQRRANVFFSSGVLLGVITSLVMILAMIVFTNIANYDKLIISCVYIISGAVLFTTINLIFQSIFIAFEKAELSLYGNVTSGLIKFISGFLALKFGYGLYGIIWAFTISSLAGLFVNFILMQKYVHPVKLVYNRKILKWIIKTTPFFAGSQLVNAFSGNITTIILSMLLNIESVGYYGIAMQLVGAIRMVIQSYKVAIQPVTARTFKESVKELRKFCLKSMRYIAMLTIPVCAGTSILGSRIIEFIYSEKYLPAASLLKILIWIVFLYGFSMVITAILISANRQKTVFQSQVLSLAVRIIAAFSLIPFFGYWGAALAVLLSNIADFSYKYYILSKEMFKISFIHIIWRILISTVIMSVFLLVFRKLDMLILVSLGIFVFVMSQFLQGELMIDLNNFKKYTYLRKRMKS